MAREELITKEQFQQLEMDINRAGLDRLVNLQSTSVGFYGDGGSRVVVPEGMTIQEFRTHMVDNFDADFVADARRGHLQSIADGLTERTGLSPLATSIDAMDGNSWRIETSNHRALGHVSVERVGTDFQISDMHGNSAFIRLSQDPVDPTRVNLNFELKAGDIHTDKFVAEVNKVTTGAFGNSAKLSSDVGRFGSNGQVKLSGNGFWDGVADRTLARRVESFETQQTVQKFFQSIDQGGILSALKSDSGVNLQDLPPVRNGKPDPLKGLMTEDQLARYAEIEARIKANPDDLMASTSLQELRSNTLKRFEGDLVSQRTNTLVDKGLIDADVGRRIHADVDTNMYAEASRQATAAADSADFDRMMQQSFVPSSDIGGSAPRSEALKAADADFLERVTNGEDPFAANRVASQPDPSADEIGRIFREQTPDIPADISASGNDDFAALLKQPINPSGGSSGDMGEIEITDEKIEALIGLSDDPDATRAMMADASMRADAHSSGGGIKGGARGAVLQGAMAVVAVGVFMASTPSSAHALPMEAQGYAIDQDYATAAVHIQASGDYEGLMQRASLIAGEMGQSPEEAQQALAEFIASKANGDMPHAVEALATGFGIKEETVEAAINGDVETLAPIVGAGLLGQEAMDHFAAAEETGFASSFAVSSGNPSMMFLTYAQAYADGDLDKLIDAQVHELKGTYAAAANLLDFDPAKAWQTGDTVMGSVDNVIHETASAAWSNTGGAALDLAGMAIDAGYVAFGYEPPTFGPTAEQKAQAAAYNAEFDTVETAVQAFIDYAEPDPNQELPNGAPQLAQILSVYYADITEFSAAWEAAPAGLEKSQLLMELETAEENFSNFYDEIGPEGLQGVVDYINEQINPSVPAEQPKLLASLDNQQNVALHPGASGPG